MRARVPVWAIAAILVACAAVAACRTTNDDVHRWANTAQGPRKLVAVVVHEKYDADLRVEAAMTLIGMKPRAGRRIGIDRLLEALNSMPEAERQALVAHIVPLLVEEIRKPPTGSGEARVDTSIAYKDAAYALLTNESGPLVQDEQQVEALRAALAQWAVTDFSNRMDDSSQKYGMEQLLRHLGAYGVKALPSLIRPDAPKIDRIAGLVADLGDQATKVKASERLVEVAKQINSDRWKQSKAPKVEAANRASKLKPTKKQFQKQLDQFQEEELLRIFGSMKKVNQPPAVAYLIDYAADKSNPEKRRAAALAALEGRVDRNNKKQIEQLLALAGAADTPDKVRDVALRRVGELPRQVVIDRLYKLFEHENWKVRWVAAELVLKMSNQKHLDEFMNHLGETEGMAITEPLRYGKLLGSLKGKTAPEELADKYASKKYPAPVRLTALSYYYQYGHKGVTDKVRRYQADREKVPECAEEAEDCEWKCAIAKGELKDIETVGDFAEHCVLPAMQKRNQKPKKKEAEGKEKED